MKVKGKGERKKKKADMLDERKEGTEWQTDKHANVQRERDGKAFWNRTGR